MSKYDALWQSVADCLEQCAARKLTLTFAEAEESAKCKIDHSFLTYKREAEKYGFKVGKISLKEQKITFEKI